MRARGEQKREIRAVPSESRPDNRAVLITGGAGFIGSNLADRLLTGGESVLVFDNLSRAGSEKNLNWLKARHGSGLQVMIADVLDPDAVRRAVAVSKMVYHFAAQVAVTTSLENPIGDFEANMRGTLNVLEALRIGPSPSPIIYTSTNKVYGPLGDVILNRNGTRYEPADPAVFTGGIGEGRPLRFYSPYGCSKGAADQYVLDYAGIYGLKTAVFRMSCIYGPRQCGTEDQGWIAHFLIRGIRGENISIFGNGMQVRDVLYIDDLVDAFLLAREHIGQISGEAFNIGGGPRNTISLIELLNIIRDIRGAAPLVRPGEWRPGDQRYYVSDTRKFQAVTGWAPKIGVQTGVRRLYGWLQDQYADPVPMHGEVI